MKSRRFKRFPIWAAVFAVVALSGCRAISRFGESRQSIAARKLSRQGQRAMHQGEWEVAEQLFGDALGVSSHDDRAHWGLAESMWQRGQREEAIVHMEQAVRLSADDPVLLSRLGRMYVDLGMMEKAKTQCELALRADRNSAETWALQGDCLAKDSRWEEALSAYHRALAIQPDHETALLQSAQVYRRQGRHDRLLATVDRMADHLGQQHVPAEADLLRGIAMRRLGRHREAIRSLTIAATKSPKNPEPRLELASIAIERGEHVVAQEELAAALQIDPDLASNENAMRPFQVPQFAMHYRHLVTPMLR